MADLCDPRFERLVALGDSVMQGTQNVGVSRRSQQYSLPVLLARQAGAELPLPLLAEPGYPPHVDRLGMVIRSRLTHPEYLRGTRLNPAVAPRNYAVAGARLSDVLGLTCANMAALRRTRAIQRLMRLVLNPEQRPEWEGLSQVDRAIAEDPTLVLLWAGANDVIEPLFYARHGVTPTPVFERLWHRTLDRLLAETTATVVLLTLPLLTQLPMLRVWSHLPRLQALAGATVDEFNAVIRASVARSPRLVLADVEPEIRRILRTGQSVAGWQLPCQVHRGYLDFGPLRGLGRQVWSGGLITFDGLHPTHTGTALLTNVVIDALRARGWNVPRIDLAAVARDDDLLQHPSPHSWAALRYYLRRNYDRSVEATTARTWPIELRRGREV